MAWTYCQRTGYLLRPDGSRIAQGYSGSGQFKNDPSFEGVKDCGPIPKGLYYIGKPINTVTHGPYVLPLTPSPQNTMFQRAGFLIHGDSVIEPGTASKGCIIMPRDAREAIGSSDDIVLAVIEE